MTNPRDVVIVEALRTASGRGRPGGSLSDCHPVDLLADMLSAVFERTGLDPSLVDDVFIGCVSQVGEQSATPGRMAWLGAGLPVHVPAATIDRKCGSSQQAIAFASQAIRSGDCDIVVAGGVESMSRVPMGSARQGADPYGTGTSARFAPGLVGQGVAAELVAARWGLSRDALDTYAARSHALAASAREHGSFAREIVTVRTPAGPVSRDESIRPGTDLAALSALEPVFRTDELETRFPGIDWKITAGNSSQIVDGASVLILMSRDRAASLGLPARARVVASVTVGDDPLLMLAGPIPATRKILQRTGMELADLDHVEINEAFAPVPLAWLAEFDFDPERVNPRGGAIALGHPLGASGARLMTTMLHALEDAGHHYGLQLMCEAGGMASATVIERLDA